MDLIDEGIKILRLENMELYNGAVDKRAKKKKKRAIFSTKLVLTTEWAKAFISVKEAAKEAKQRTKNIKYQLRKERNDIVTIAKAQV